MKTLLAAFVFVVSWSSVTFASCSGVACNDIKITEIYPTDGHTYIKTDGIEADLGNCVPIGNVYLKLLNTHSSVDRIYSLLLSAYLSNLDVDIRTNDTAGNTGDCTIAYAKLN